MAVRFFFLGVLVLFTGTLAAQSPQVQTLNPSQDNSLFEDPNGALSNGQGIYLFSGKTNQPLLRRAMLKFDIAGNIPSNATITGVSLELFMDLTIAGNTPMSLHALNSSWGEGASDAPGQEGTGTAAASGDVTWLHRFFPGSNWSNPGGDFQSSADATANVASVGTYTWSSPALLSRVQSWFSNPSLNHGWILIGDETTNPTAKRFYSRENPNMSGRPKLIVTYTVPCIAPGIPTVNFNSSPICSGDSLSMQVNGALNSAGHWALYSSSCGGLLVDTNHQGSFVVAPNQTTTYFVLGEGGCVSPGSCANFTVQVNPTDDPTFAFSSNAFCSNDADPIPQISGTLGGSFSIQPSTMPIQSSTGEVDLSLGQSGTTYQILYTTPGPACPDTASQFLTLNPVFSSLRFDTICQGDSLLFGSQYFSQAGNYVETFASVAGCDSVVTMELTLNPSQNLVVQDTLCTGDTLVYGNQTIVAQGQYLISLQNQLGCDSLIQLNIQEWPVFNNSLSLDLCQGDSTFFNGQWLNQAGIYLENLSSIHGCDSSTQLNINALPVYLQNQSNTICQGDSVQFGGQFLTNPGQYIDTLSTVSGCDSVIQFTLNVLNVFSTQDTAAICQGDSLFFGNQFLSQAGNYNFLFQTSGGCDSLVDLNLIVNPNFQTFDTLQICSGDSLLFQGNYLSSAGDYQANLSSVQGCDSTLLLHLNVFPVHQLVDSLSICSGDSVQFGGQFISQAGQYIDSLQSTQGCDSIRTLVLDLYPSFALSDTVSLCSGDSLVYGNLTINQGGLYNLSFSTQQGCDSLVDLLVQEIQIDTSVSLVGSTLEAQAQNADFQWIQCDAGNIPVPGAQGQSFTPTSTGSYAVVVSQNGCVDSSSCIAVQVTSLLEYQNQPMVYPVPAKDHIRVYWEAKGTFVLMNSQGQHVATWEHHSGWQTLALPPLPSGMYVLLGPAGFSQSLPLQPH